MPTPIDNFRHPLTAPSFPKSPTVLPALLVWHEQHRRLGPTRQRRARAGTRGGDLALFSRAPRASLAVSVLLAGGVLGFIGRVKADYALLHLQARRPAPLPRSTGRAVLFASLSNLIGFGSVMISRHWGIFSIGLLLTVGVASVLLASVTVLPSLLAILSAPGRARSDEPATADEPSATAQLGPPAHQHQPRPTLADRRA